MSRSEPAAPTIADRLDEIRRAHFIGRGAERELFGSMLARGTPCTVLLLHGQGGIGKTSLLQEFARLAAQSRRPVVRLDGRQLEPVPERLRAAFREAAAAVPAGVAPVVLIDTFELLQPLELWLRDEFIPALPRDSVVVIAGRHAPDVGWRSDPGWSLLSAVRRLHELDGPDARLYLQARRVDAALQQRAVDVAGGHPLALALVADALRAGRTEVLESSQARVELIDALVERFAEHTPGPHHERALRALILAPSINESLLSELVPGTPAATLYDWLRRLPFVEQGAHGLIPHDLVRDSFDSVLRRRDPEARKALQREIRRHVDLRLHRGGEVDQYRHARDWLFMWRHHMPINRLIDWRQDGFYSDQLRPGDALALQALFEREAGPASAAIARHWLARQPAGWRVTRDRAGAPVGAFLIVDLAALEPQDAASDPVVPLLWRAMADAPLRPGQAAWLTRFAIHAGCGSGSSPTLNAVALRNITAWLCHPGLAWTFVTSPSVEILGQLMTGAELFHRHERDPAADFSCDGQVSGTFVRDWRERPHVLWPDKASRPDKAAYLDAARDAVRNFARADALRASALAHACDADAVQTLRARIAAAVDTLAEHPRDRKFHAAVKTTFLEPGRSQERVAEDLGLPLNTFRYQLKKGLDLVAEKLWLSEASAAASATAAR